MCLYLCETSFEIMPKQSSTCFKTEKENEASILAVQDLPCLWDSSKQAYGRANRRNMAWEKVAERCGLPGQDEKNFII